MNLYRLVYTLRKTLNDDISLKRLPKIKKEMADLHRCKEKLLDNNINRVVFESVVEKIIIGGYNDEGVEEPLNITFVYKNGIHSNFNGKDFKPKRKNAAAAHNDTKLCFYTSDEAKKMSR